jgi:hypothetical protein
VKLEAVIWNTTIRLRCEGELDALPGNALLKAEMLMAAVNRFLTGNVE